jgi:hypothetical protein
VPEAVLPTQSEPVAVEDWAVARAPVMFSLRGHAMVCVTDVVMFAVQNRNVYGQPHWTQTCCFALGDDALQGSAGGCWCRVPPTGVGVYGRSLPRPPASALGDASRQVAIAS